jgi:hypothetical protein
MLEYYSTYDSYRENYKKYHNHIFNHICAVQCIYRELKKRIKIPDNAKNALEFNIEHHDSTKTSYSEFDGYLQWFYAEDINKKDKTQFNIAKNHQQKTNRYNWEYWVLIDNTDLIALEMPLKYVLQLLCDWSATAIEYGGLPSKFYHNTKDKKILHEKTKEKIIKYLPVFDEIVKDIKVECHNIYY